MIATPLSLGLEWFTGSSAQPCDLHYFDISRNSPSSPALHAKWATSPHPTTEGAADWNALAGRCFYEDS
jgi:hypothetical protein